MLRGLAPFKALGFCDFVFLIGFAHLYFFQLDGLLDDPGIGWHLANGFEILKSGNLPTHDVLLASRELRPWIADQWLGDLLMSVLYSYGGWSSVSLFFFLLFYLTYFLLLFNTVKQNTSSVIASGIVTLIVFKASQVQFLARPLLFGFLFMVLLLRSIHLYSKSPQVLKLGLSLLPIFLLWSNLHPSFVLGLIVLGIYLAGAIIDEFRGRVFNIHNHLHFAILLLALLLSTLCNPYGIALHESIIWLNSSNIKSIYIEWQPLQLSSPEGLFFEIAVGVLLFNWIFFSGGKRLPAWVFISFVIFGHAALSAVRMLPYFMIIMAVPLATSLSFFGEILAKTSLNVEAAIKKAWFKWDNREDLSLHGMVSVSAVSLICLLFFLSEFPTLIRMAQIEPSRSEFPYESIEYLKSSYSPKPVVVLNNMDFGGFIDFEGQGEVKAVIDDRSSLLGDAFYEKHFDSLRIGGNWRDWAVRNEASFILLKPTQHLSSYFKHCYPEAVVVEESAAVLFDLDKMAADCKSTAEVENAIDNSHNLNGAI